MSTNYRVIWIDDSPTWVDSVVDEIKEHIIEAGYEPVIERFENGDTLVAKCQETDWDLLIVDNKLPGDDGNVLISKIRAGGSFTQIVFYSQDQPSTELIGSLDGIFHCQREGASEKIKRVIDLTLHKLKDLGVVRGLIIAAAIDIEVKMEELMAKLFGDNGMLFRERVLDKQMLDCAKKFQFLQGVLKDRIEACAEGDEKEKLKTASEVFKKFDAEVLDHRNILAHSRRSEEAGKVILKGINKRTEKLVFDDAWLSKLRDNIRAQSQNLGELERLLCPDAASA